MSNNGAEQREEQQRGHVLLIAGDQAMHRRRPQVLPSQNLTALTVLPTPVLLGSDVPADATHLDGVRDQNSTLQRLRVAASTPGPLLVYLSGRLTTDRKAHQLHLALAGTTAANVRYTALPWQWLRHELRLRPPGTSTLLVDLAADKGAWEQLQDDIDVFTAGFTLYGVVSPPGFPGAGSDGVSDYTRGVIDVLRRSADRPTHAQLHAAAVAAARFPPGTLVLPMAPALSPANAAYDDAGAPAPMQKPVDAGIPVGPEPVPDRQVPQPSPPAAPPTTPSAPPAAPPAPPYAASAPLPAPSAPDVSPAHAPLRPEGAQSSGADAPHPAPGRLPLPPALPFPQQASAPLSPPGPTPVRQEQWWADVQPSDAPPPAPAEQHPAPPMPSVPPPAPAFAPPVAESAPQEPPAQQPAATQPDPRPLIWQAAQAGRHSQAAEMAEAWEQQALQRYGFNSPEATQWAEIRADLARIAGSWAQATQLWVAAAHTRLGRQAADAPEVLNAAKGAHYCWLQLEDSDEALEYGPELLNLLRQLPQLDPRHLSTAQQRMKTLQSEGVGWGGR
ncbi:hypothetical protein QOM21_34470 [Streptomyces sp. Pv4-95]|uniref:hypothetical protein n=1 Tax=Streptomyces sp. Pv4-95 TaxID=3049543 RepID=UPI003891F230